MPAFLPCYFPYRGYSHRIDETADQLSLKGWHLNQTDWELLGQQPSSLVQGERGFFFGVRKLKKGLLDIEVSADTDLYLEEHPESIRVYGIGIRPCEIRWERFGGNEGPPIELKPGSFVEIPK